MTSASRATTPRIAVIGCGAIARLFHVPALTRQRERVAEIVFVDPDATRAQALAADAGGGPTATNVGAVIGRVDAAIVCVPHHLHVPVCRQLLEAGVHVFCEKPLAERADEVRGLVSASARSGAALAVNNMRRAYPAMREIARLVHSGELGAIREIRIRWGEKFDWDAASGFYFGAQARNRGALLDRGAHVLDLVCWWLGGEPKVGRYLDDSEGGSEAMADLSFSHGAATGRVELSWLARYENTIDLSLDRGTISCGIYEWTRFTVTETGKHPRAVQLPAPAAAPREIGNVMLANFLDVIAGTATPIVPAAAVVDSISLIASAYGARQPLPQPWHDAYRRVIDA